MTGIAPCMQMMGCDLCTQMHLLAPDIGGHVCDGLTDQHSWMGKFAVGASVWVRNFREGLCWVKAIISDRLGPVSYLIKLEKGDFWWRHVDHLQPDSEVPPAKDHPESEDIIIPNYMPADPGADNPAPPTATDEDLEISPGIPAGTLSNESTQSSDGGLFSQTPQYPSCAQNPPDQLYGTLPN